MSRTLDALLRELEAAGLKPGTPKYDRELRARKVLMCKEQRAVASCWECSYFDHCELIKAHLCDLYGVDSSKKDDTYGDSTTARTGK